MGSDDSDIVEKSPTGRFIRYDQILGVGTRGKTLYRGFDTAAGKEVDWNKVKVAAAADDGSSWQESSLEHLEGMISSELLTLKSLKHPNIIKARASWVDRGNRTINIVTESFTSGTLRQFRRKHKGVDLTAVKNWGKQILLGLLYLHSHKPPVIHGDLNCDNIFINGNTGEVKIGAIGFATVTQKQQLELLSEEKYDDLIDVYSFGLCVLELVTCEIPFSEYKDQSQVYKKVVSGMKPLALGKVKDLLVKKFIERCLCTRSGVAELLKDPFFSCDYFLQQPEPEAPLIANSSSEISPLSGSGYRCFNKRSEFRLSGERIGGNLISFKLFIARFHGQANKKIEFNFDLSADTALAVAGEMVDDLGLAVEDVALIAELMDRVIASMEPCWKGSFVKPSHVNSVLVF